MIIKGITSTVGLDETDEGTSGYGIFSVAWKLLVVLGMRSL